MDGLKSSKMTAPKQVTIEWIGKPWLKSFKSVFINCISDNARLAFTILFFFHEGLNFKLISRLSWYLYLMKVLLKVIGLFQKQFSLRVFWKKLSWEFLQYLQGNDCDGVLLSQSLLDTRPTEGHIKSLLFMSVRLSVCQCGIFLRNGS